MQRMVVRGGGGGEGGEEGRVWKGLGGGPWYQFLFWVFCPKLKKESPPQKPLPSFCQQKKLSKTFDCSESKIKHLSFFSSF